MKLSLVIGLLGIFIDILVAMTKCLARKWLEEERVYFGSQFEGALHCDGEGVAAGTQAASHRQGEQEEG